MCDAESGNGICDGKTYLLPAGTSEKVLFQGLKENCAVALVANATAASANDFIRAGGSGGNE